MSDYSQMLKGILEGCILSLISEKEAYGYELSEKLLSNGFPSVSEGSIYPLLSRMQKEGWISAEFKDSDNGPKRKYYQLTPAGEQTLLEFKSKWDILKYCVDNTLKGGKENEIC